MRFVALGIIVLLDVPAFLIFALQLFRRRVVVEPLCLTFSLGTKFKREVLYEDICSVERVPSTDASYHRQWDYGYKAKKLVILCKSGERSYVSVTDPERFRQAMNERLELQK